ncbi:MAG: hypothetical protein WC595_05340 [Candidatus Nanoarchaeia archaeon]
MADNKIQMPSSGGGFVRYSDEIKSKLMIPPLYVIILIAVVILVEIYFYKFG